MSKSHPAFDPRGSSDISQGRMLGEMSEAVDLLTQALQGDTPADVRSDELFYQTYDLIGSLMDFSITHVSEDDARTIQLLLRELLESYDELLE